MVAGSVWLPNSNSASRLRHLRIRSRAATTSISTKVSSCRSPRREVRASMTASPSCSPSSHADEARCPIETQTPEDLRSASWSRMIPYRGQQTQDLGNAHAEMGSHFAGVSDLRVQFWRLSGRVYHADALRGECARGGHMSQPRSLHRRGLEQGLHKRPLLDADRGEHGKRLENRFQPRFDYWSWEPVIWCGVRDAGSLHRRWPDSGSCLSVEDADPRKRR